jgi:thiol-disulfide isomerase/thioredoxin
MAWWCPIRLGALGFCLVSSLQSAESAPLNDNFSNRTQLSGTTNFVLGSNLGATAEAGEPAHAAVQASSSVWWSWTAPLSGTFSVSTVGSSFDTLVAVYRGSSITNLQSIVSDDDSGVDGTSLTLFRAIAGETYEIAVDGFQGANGRIVLRVGPSGYAQPAWSLQTPSGVTVPWTAFRNKVVMIDFFETVCQACIEESPSLIELRRLQNPLGFEIVAIAKDNSVANVVYNVRSMGITYPVLLNKQEVEASFGGPLPLPTKFLVDREGKIQRVLVGAGYTLNDYYKMVLPLVRGAAQVEIKLQAEPGRARVSWPATEFGWVMDSASSLRSPWSQVSLPTFETNNQTSVYVPTTGPRMFYRLRKQ